MGCCSSSVNKEPVPVEKKDGPSTSIDKKLEVKGDPDKNPENRRSLSNYNKTKGGSLIFNVSQKNMMGEEKIDFVDEQHITSPAKADWKVGKAIKRAPDMKETVTIPIMIPTSQGGGYLQAEVGYKTLQGKNPKPPHKPNQDALAIFIVEGHPNLVVFACFE